jgi:hypothetical protein
MIEAGVFAIEISGPDDFRASRSARDHLRSNAKVVVDVLCPAAFSL